MENAAYYFKNADVYYNEAFSRNIGLLTEQEQKKLRNSGAAIVGLGGVGGFHLMNLVRLGVGKFNIADMDSFEVVNIQRQCGADIHTLGRNKAEVMKEAALSVNPHLEIKAFREGVSSDNIGEFFSGMDILIDGIDFFSLDERRLIFREAKARGIYAVTAAPLGFGSALLIFSPCGMSFDNYFDINDEMSYLEKIVAFGLGLAPSCLHLKYIDLNSVDLNAKKGPSLVSACYLCSAWAATEVLAILLKRKKPKAAPFYFQFDPYGQKFKKGYLIGGNRNPLQRLKRRYILRKLSLRKDERNK